MKKIIYIILDGFSVAPGEKLSAKTPLEVAKAPNLDRLAQKGRTGLVDIFPSGVAAEPESAMINLLGYSAEKCWTSLGPLEALAAGITISAGNLALSADFASVEPDGKTVKEHRLAGTLSAQEAVELAEEINNKVALSGATFEFKSTAGARAVLLLRGIRSKLSAGITDTDPAYQRQGKFSIRREKFPLVISQASPMLSLENDIAARETSDFINEFTEKSHRVLVESTVNKRRVEQGKPPANMVLCHSAGDSLPELPKIAELYKMKFACFTETAWEQGIALLSGMEIVEVPSSSGRPEVDYSIWAKVVLASLNKYDALYVHINGSDGRGSGSDFLKQKEFIEDIDKFFFSVLVPGIDLRDYLIPPSQNTLGDECEEKASAGCHWIAGPLGNIRRIRGSICVIANFRAPVPLLICGANIAADGSLSFSERACSSGSLGRLTAQEVLPLLVRFGNKAGRE